MFSSVYFAVVAVLIGHCLAQPCHDGMVKYTNSPSCTTKLSCINGTWVAKACQTHDGQLLDEGQTLVLEPYLIQCQKARDDAMIMMPIGCFKNGRMIAPSDSMETIDSFYTCVPKRDGMSFQLSGCTLPRPSDRRVPFETTKRIGSTIFKCTLKGSNAKLEPVGCFFNNQTHALDEKVVRDQYWYVCEKTDDNRSKMTTKGCVNDLMPVNVGDIFHSQGIIYECQSSENGIKTKITGCLEVTSTQNIVEHNIGDGWTEGDGSQRIQYRCSDNGPVIVN